MPRKRRFPVIMLSLRKLPNMEDQEENDSSISTWIRMMENRSAAGGGRERDSSRAMEAAAAAPPLSSSLAAKTMGKAC